MNIRKSRLHFVQNIVNRELQMCEILRRQPDFYLTKGYMGTVPSRV